MASCYLTIDDSPSLHTQAVVDYLNGCGIQALFFVRGDLMEGNPTAIDYALRNGHVIGNHSFSHRPFSDLSYDEAVADIEKCEKLIESAYRKVGMNRQGKYFRFPYLDRGNGDRIERHFEKITDIDINSDPKVQKIQKYLKENAFVQPFQTTHPAYQNASIADAVDCLMTFTSYDWMLTNRHRGQWDYKTIDDLKHRIDTSELRNHTGNILIFHDQEETFETFKSLIDHMLVKGYEFLSYEN